MSTTRSDTDWERTRALFPATRTVTYLNTASYGPGPQPVLDEVQAGLAAWSEGTGSWRAWEARAEEARSLFARLIGAAPESVALVHALSAAASQVGECLPPSNGGNIVVGEAEFRSNLYPWMNQERRGYEIRMVPFREGRLPVEDLVAAIDGKTALVAVSHVQSSNGYRIDLAPLIAAKEKVGARLFVDATQSLGALRVPLAGIDFIGVAAYKWLLSPRGAGFLYVAPDRLGELVPVQPNWKTPDDPHSDYYGPPLDPPDRASKLDVSLAWPVWLGTTRALELLLEVGPEAIEARDLALSSRFRDGLPALGLRPLFEEHECSQVIGLRVPDPAAVQKALERERVVAAVRGGYLRVSFHFFNDEEDVDRGLHALAVS